MLKGDEYNGRGSSQRGLGRSPPVQHPQGLGFWKQTRNTVPRVAGKRLVCHCLPTQECHADSIIAEYKLLYLEACDREDANGTVPYSAVSARLAQLRLEPDSSEGSSPDEGAKKKKNSGWTGRGRPLLVRSSCAVRKICDGQSLASPERWAVDDRRYPGDSVWSEVAKRYMTYSEKAGTRELLTSLALVYWSARSRREAFGTFGIAYASF